MSGNPGNYCLTCENIVVEHFGGKTIISAECWDGNGSKQPQQLVINGILSTEETNRFVLNDHGRLRFQSYLGQDVHQHIAERDRILAERAEEQRRQREAAAAAKAVPLAAPAHGPQTNATETAPTTQNSNSTSTKYAEIAADVIAAVVKRLVTG